MVRCQELMRKVRTCIEISPPIGIKTTTKNPSMQEKNEMTALTFDTLVNSLLSVFDYEQIKDPSFLHANPPPIRSP